MSSNNNQPNANGENNETQKAKRDSRVETVNQNVVTNQTRGLKVETAANLSQAQNQNNQNDQKINNPYVNTRSATVFNRKGLKNKIANNPFADGDGGGDANVNENVDGKIKLDKSNLDPRIRFLLRHYLDLANPVYEQEEQTITLTRRGAQPEEVKRKRPVFKGYQFYLIDGKSMDEWLAENVGEGYKIDPMTKEIFKEGSTTNTQVQQTNQQNQQQAQVQAQPQETQAQQNQRNQAQQKV